MELTPENKAYIDGMSYTQLLEHWEFFSIDDPWFEGETGKYWAERMEELREKTALQKNIGLILPLFPFLDLQ